MHVPPDSAPASAASGAPLAFAALSLSEPVLQAVHDLGYETPSPIQAATIPVLLAGRDVIGQAQTGTGKTAAFALPILSGLDPKSGAVQALVLTPTRELAIQVAEAFHSYAAHIPGFRVMPIYGGQSYGPQLQALRRGVQVVVATPGRAMDHIKRGTLDLSALRVLVLDEADEMLRMGFIDDVEWILEQTPAKRQITLFSATLPPQVRRIAQRHLNNPEHITIKSKTTTASQIRQRYWMVSGVHKLDALTRILEAEAFEAMIVFTRTKLATEELTEKLAARGFAVEALNGDIQQAQRERTVARLRNGQIDIVVATDVAARGLDVERITHVVNFDVPHDPESYVHRIGRTGRAGRSGEAILFIAPRERRLLRSIEHATRQPITPMDLPTADAVNQRRIERFNEKLTAAIASGVGAQFNALIQNYQDAHDVPALDIAAALAGMAQGDTPLLLQTGRSRRYEDDRRDAPPRREPTREYVPASAPPVRTERQNVASEDDVAAGQADAGSSVQLDDVTQDDEQGATAAAAAATSQTTVDVSVPADDSADQVRSVADTNHAEQSSNADDSAEAASEHEAGAEHAAADAPRSDASAAEQAPREVDERRPGGEGSSFGGDDRGAERDARPFGDRPPRGEGGFNRDARPFGERPRRDGDSFGARDRAPRSFDDRRPRSEGDSFGNRDHGSERDSRPFSERPRRDGDSFGARDRAPRSFDDRRPRSEGDSFGNRDHGSERDSRPFSERPRRDGDSFGARDRAPRSFDDRRPRSEGGAFGTRDGGFDRDSRSFGERPRPEGDSFGARDRGPRSFDDRRPREGGSFGSRDGGGFDRGSGSFGERPRRDGDSFGDRGGRSFDDRPRRDDSFQSRDRGPQSFDDRGPRGDRDSSRPPQRRGNDQDMLTYRVEVGEMHGVKPGNIVGAIANEAGLEGRYIGRVQIREDHSFIDLPSGMPKEIFQQLRKTRVGGQQLQISLALKTQARRLHEDRGDQRPPRSGPRPGGPRPGGPRPSGPRPGGKRPFGPRNSR